MSPRALGAGIALALAVALAATPAAAAPLAAAPLAAPGTPEVGERRVIATSTQGVPVIARQFGASDAPVQLVVIGQMHGSEPGGRAVVRELRDRPLPEGVGVWLR